MFKVGFGFRLEQGKAVTVKIPAAECYSLSIMDIYPLLFEDQSCGAETEKDAYVGTPGVFLKPAYCKALGIFSSEGFENFAVKAKNSQADRTKM